MKSDKFQDKIDKSTDALINSGKPKEHTRQVPTAKDLKRKFVTRVDRKGKPTIREVDWLRLSS